MDELEEQRVLAQKMREFFSSPDEAAISALNKILEKNYELGGVITQSGDRFFASEPQGNKNTGKFEARVKIPKGEKPVAIYHTHPFEPGNSDAERFSPGDVEIANRMKMLSYIRALESGKIKKYTPGKSRTYLRGRG